MIHTMYVVVAAGDDDDVIICETPEPDHARLVAAALSRCDSARTPFDVYSRNATYIGKLARTWRYVAGTIVSIPEETQQ